MILEISTENKIIILDEAHNIEKIAKDCCSYSIKLEDITYIKRKLSLEKLNLFFDKLSELKEYPNKRYLENKWK